MPRKTTTTANTKRRGRSQARADQPVFLSPDSDEVGVVAVAPAPAVAQAPARSSPTAPARPQADAPGDDDATPQGGQQDDEPAQDVSFGPPPAASTTPAAADRPYIQVHDAPRSNSGHAVVLELEPTAIIPTLIALGRWRHALYLARNLLCVEVAGDVVDLPEVLTIKFSSDEWPATARECRRLTAELWREVTAKCLAAEDAWRDGKMDDGEYRRMVERYAKVSAMWDRVGGAS